MELAETLGAAVWDCDSRLNFPSEHPLNLSMDSEGCYKDADVVLTLDIADFEKPTHVRDIATRTVVSMVPEDATWIDIGYTDTEISKWAMTYARPFYAHQRMTADPVTAAPALTKLLKERIAKTPGRADADRQADRRGGQAPRRDPGRVAAAGEGGPLGRGAHDRAAAGAGGVGRHQGRGLGADLGHAARLGAAAVELRQALPPRRPRTGHGTQIGISLGVALAHRGRRPLVVDLQPDGDLMFDAGSLWIAAKYQIPMLIVMYNNRAYYNDWNHQIVMARNRGTDPSRAHIGMDLCGPDPDFATLARSMGWYGEGPIENADDLRPALDRAIEQVKQGKPALVDTITQRR